MSKTPIGEFTFPGINKIVSGTFTLSHGISPSAAMIQIPPQDNFTVPAGTLAITYGGTRIEFPDCRLDMASLEVGDNGQIWTLKILDRRWKWQFGKISGHWNILKPDRTFDLDREKSPQDLAKLLLDAMGEKRYDVSQLPNQTRPLTYWDYENPAEQLQRLCESLDCRIVLRTDNRVYICRNGVGQQLPTDRISGGGYGFDPVETPDSIEFVLGQTKWQGRLDLEAVGIDVDGKIKPIKDLSYNPAGEGEEYGWAAQNPTYFQGLIKYPSTEEQTRYNELVNELGKDNVVASGETNPSQLAARGEEIRQLAMSCVYKMYRITQPSTRKMEIPEFGPIEKIEQLLPLDETLLTPANWKDQLGKQDTNGFPLKQSAQVFGIFYNRISEPSLNINTLAGTKYPGSFSVDSERGIVVFSEPVFITVIVPGTESDQAIKASDGTVIVSPGSYATLPAHLQLECTFGVKDSKTRVHVRHAISKNIANSKYKTGPRIVKREDVVMTHRIEYKTQVVPSDYGIRSVTTWDDVKNGLGSAAEVFQVVTNKEEVKRQSDYYIESEVAAFTPKENSNVSYPYIRLIELDGAIQQITWTVGSGGATTQAGRNNEFTLSIPSYAERRNAEIVRRIREKVATTLDNQI